MIIHISTVPARPIFISTCTTDLHQYLHDLYAWATDVHLSLRHDLYVICATKLHTIGIHHER